MLQAKLLGVASIESIHKKNLEILNDRGKKYRPGQFSVLTSWNMAGVLDEERNLCKDIVQIANQPKEVSFCVSFVLIIKISEIFLLKRKIKCDNFHKLIIHIFARNIFEVKLIFK